MCFDEKEQNPPMKIPLLLMMVRELKLFHHAFRHECKVDMDEKQ